MIWTSTWSSAPVLRVRYWALVGAGLAAVALCLWVNQRPFYYPGLSPIAGHRLWNATQPRGLVAGVTKEMQSFFEVTPCEYTIMGWDTGGTLYFEALCAGQLQLWTAQPEKPESVRQIGRLPSNLADAPLSQNEVLPLLRAASVWPPSAEPSARRIHIQSQPHPSPDGAWLAFISKRVYGPQDVLLLSAAPVTND